MIQEHVSCPVTALALVQGQWPLIVSGEGPFLKVLNYKDQYLLLTYRLFDSFSIHGLDCASWSDGEISCLAWGGCSVAIVKISVWERGDFLEANVTQIWRETQAEQWILRGRMLQDPDAGHGNNSPTALLGSVFNELMYLQCGNNEDLDHVLFIERPCENAQVMLYSMEFCKLGDQVLIASGSLFGELLLRRHSLKEPHQQCDTLLTCRGHEGSIFGISIALLSDGRAILVTCSDDRTIRVWDAGCAMASSDTAKITTGMLSVPVAQASGHLSRIWSVNLTLLDDFSGVILSYGEDGATQEWNLILPGLEASAIGWKLMAANRLKVHAGRNIWSAHSICTNGIIAVATGGADGRIVISRAGKNTTTLPLPVEAQIVASGGTVPAISSSGEKTDADDKTKAVIWTNGQDLLAVTENGRVLRGQYRATPNAHEALIVRPSRVEWEMVFQSKILGPHASICRIGSFGAAIASVSGSLHLYEASKNTIEHIADSFRIKSMHSLVVTRNNTPYPSLFVSSGGNETCSVFQFEREGVTRCELHLPSKLTVTAVSYIAGHSLLLVGTKSGAIVMWSFSDESTFVPDWLIPSVHGRDAVTCILDLGDQKSLGTLILTVGRDCRIMVHSISHKNEQYELSKIHDAEVPGGICPEGVTLTEKGNDLLIWGFRGVELVLFNLSKDSEVARIDIGGSHRAWDILPWAAGTNTVRASWARGAKYYTYISENASYEIVQTGTHGREIKALARNSNAGLLATGSEDTDIHIYRYVSQPYPRLRILSRIRKHNTGLCSLRWSQNGKYLFSAAGKEEFFVWRIHQLPHIHIGVVCIAECPPVTSAADLRITDFDVKQVGSEDGGEAFLINMVYSDSSTRLWALCPSKPRLERFRLVAEGTYGTRCLTSTHFLSGARNPEYFVTGSTDGNLAFWPVTEQLGIRDAPLVAVRPVLQHAVHQSAVKTFDIAYANGQGVIASGGDDNGLGLTFFSTDGDGGVRASTLLIPKAHAAAVTSVKCFKPERDSPKLWIGTTGNDQMLKLWTVDVSGMHETQTNMFGIDGVNVQKVSEVKSSIADACDIATLDGASESVNGLIVAGVGIEFWPLPS